MKNLMFVIAAIFGLVITSCEKENVEILNQEEGLLIEENDKNAELLDVFLEFDQLIQNGYSFKDAADEISMDYEGVPATQLIFTDLADLLRDNRDKHEVIYDFESNELSKVETGGRISTNCGNAPYTYNKFKWRIKFKNCDGTVPVALFLVDQNACYGASQGLAWIRASGLC